MASNRKSKRGEELTKNNEPSTLKMQESPPASTQTSLSPLVIRPSLCSRIVVVAGMKTFIILK